MLAGREDGPVLSNLCRKRTERDVLGDGTVQVTGDPGYLRGTERVVMITDAPADLVFRRVEFSPRFNPWPVSLP